jgi:hypothetical protein
MELDKGMAVINYGRFPNTSYDLLQTKIPNVILIWPKELIFRCFTRSELEYMIIEIREHTVHLRPSLY